MLSAISINLINPSFESDDNVLFRHYGTVASDLSNCLHQVCSFVKNKFTPNVKYGFKANVDIANEEVITTTKKNSTISVNLLQKSDITDIFDEQTRLDSDTVISEFDIFVRKSKDRDLKYLAEHYRIFLLSLVPGFIYGDVVINDDSLKLYIGRYGYNCEPIVVVMELISYE